MCVLVAGCGGGSHPRAPVPAPTVALPSGDPLAYSPAREADFVRRATAGLAHVLYAKSPGGIAASVARTEHWRAPIAAAAAAAGVDADTLEALILLESAGRADAIAGGDVSGAAGLTQIVASTGTGLLGMRIDLAASRLRTRQLARALARHQVRRAGRLAALRRSADPRFDPVQALAATAHYLRLALSRFGRSDLAVESYHMGIGNLQTALSRYGAGASPEPSYARLYFDSTPSSHASAWGWLSSLGDDSATYLWRVYAARQIVELARANPAAFAQQAQLQVARNSAEEVLHPPATTPVYADPSSLQTAETAGQLIPLPATPLAGDGIAIDRGMGSLAGRVGADASLYRALRPGALALLGYVGAQVQRISGVHPLTVTSTVRDEHYQRLLAGSDLEATPGYSLHTTGWAFDISRHYLNGAQAQALQFELDRLTALDLIAWVREPAAIHVAVAPDAGALLGG
jgi:hypothetical protein